MFLLDDLLFEPGSADLNPDFSPLIQIGVNLLAVRPDSFFTITGHTDNVGSEDDNLALSQARVDTVKDAYIELGADADRIDVVARGESEPVADNDTEEGRALNRRVDLVISSTVGDG